jgi:acyl carrier protein
MDDQQIFESLRTILKSINCAAEINEESALIGDSILDSLEFMNYLTKVEELFKITISDSEIKKLQLGIIINMVRFISSKPEKIN